MMNAKQHGLGTILWAGLGLAVWLNMGLTAASLPAHAAPTVNIITVTTTDDSWFPGGGCSLREALDNANNNLQRFGLDGDCPAGSATETDVIVLQSGVEYVLELTESEEEPNNSGDLDILPNGLPLDLRIEVVGGTEPAIIRTTVASQRVLDIHEGATVEIENVGFTGGWSGSGGGIRNQGTLTLTEVLLWGNTSTGGGGIYNTGTAVLIRCDVFENRLRGVGGGGGISNIGSIVLEETTVRLNDTDGGAARNGVGVHNSGEGATMWIRNSLITGNKGLGSTNNGGGAMTWARGMLYIENSVISDNTINVSNGGGGGVAVINAFAEISHTEIISNNIGSGNGGGAGVYISGVNPPAQITITHSTIAYNQFLEDGYGGGVAITEGTTATIHETSITHNKVLLGGGIYNRQGELTLTNTAVNHNEAIHEYGGGIANELGGILHATNVSLIGNRGHSGGGLANVGPNSVATLNQVVIRDNIAHKEYGGGIGNRGGIVTLQNNSVVEGNTAVFGGGGIANLELAQMTVQDTAVYGNTSQDFGGGLYVVTGSHVTLNRVGVYSNTAELAAGGGIYNNATLQLGNSTISGNNAPAGNGGGLAADDVGNSNTMLVNVTLANNGGGLNLFKAGGTLTLQNSVLSMSGGNNCAITGSITSLGSNVASDGSCTGLDHASDQTADPLLGPLAGNGGHTLTHALLAGSPAIRVGNITACQSALVGNVDQRGFARGTAVCDAGAYEAGGGVPQMAIYLPLVLR